MRIPTPLLATFACLGLLAGTAHADILAEEAIRIARENGVVTVTDVDRDMSKWEVEGRAADGREIEVDIDATSGAVLKVERD
ncbi:YpeB-like protein with putative protease inhibitory function [Tepidamorphus gemmatus]|uniref:YpeB-like protein with putative protease inhibitory function n=1 Tax=Tepidamorphus gemmatus TaxID=747076 RepID=A0A4V2UYQ9_9HYPH|nr:PepSY domain-containing protein [Tepidamorphus gemmatus]TCT08348.1 YpeB-like protein with putative protease inhibitory function [Tepidamorphus gemmatus]